METTDRNNGWNSENPSNRLSDYDQGNQTSDFDQNKNAGRYRDVRDELDRDSQYDNSYGSGSDSSRSLLMEGNEMVFENDRQGQHMDEDWQAAREESEGMMNMQLNPDASEQRMLRSENDQRDQGL